ncbi:unnamed protein product [Angiostrongylus costaricensis]|uniref:Uncharacterized protein n=1 Tax=Angiostrongylus costaricensis TaxID=334426 RepID=A0A0R3Q254_ANGCS|nr:unnamed protein product [Angiostrongylus costaricensis]
MDAFVIAYANNSPAVLSGDIADTLLIPSHRLVERRRDDDASDCNDASESASFEGHRKHRMPSCVGQL